MQYFVFGRDRSGARELRREQTEAHWAYMDGYAGALIARGPTLTEDGQHVTGSVHIVELADPRAAHAFAFAEPYHRAGVFADVVLRRWNNDLGRTMWQFASSDDHPRFLIVGHGLARMADADDGRDADQQAYLTAYSEHLIAHGPLLSDDGSEWLGSVTLVELPDRAAADALLARSPYAEAGLYRNVEVHRWRFGGRPAA